MKHYNYFHDDFLNNWFSANEYHAITSRFATHIREKNKLFRQMIVDDVGHRKNISIPSVLDDNVSSVNDYIDKAEAYMYEGARIISNVPLNTEDGDIATFLVRSDSFHHLFDTNPLTREERHIGCKYSCGWHYCLVMVKFRTIPLKVDNETISNNTSCKILKSHIQELNEALGLLQEYTPSSAFVIGRRYKSRHQLWKRYYQRIVRIDLAIVNPIPEVPPITDEYLPNMKYNSQYQKYKEEIATDIHDITLIWNCGVKHRHLLQEQGILSFMDTRCTAEVMGFKGKRAKIINAILDHQRDDNESTLILPPHPLERYKSEYFVDFETIPSCLMDSLSHVDADSQTFLFMIGVGWEEKGEWQYQHFIAKDLTFQSEYHLLQEFIDFIPEDARLYHWHNAEPMHFQSALARHHQQPIQFKWYDLERYCEDNLITVKGCYNFKLKDMCKALYRHNLITMKWNDDMQNGLECSVDAVERYLEKKDWTEIIAYNEFDCQALWELVKLF